MVTIIVITIKSPPKIVFVVILSSCRIFNPDMGSSPDKSFGRAGLTVIVVLHARHLDSTAGGWGRWKEERLSTAAGWCRIRFWV